MASLQINTGIVTLDILDDYGNSRGLFRFNPSDITLARKIFSLQTEYSDKMKEYQRRQVDCTTAEQKFELLEDIIAYLTDSIDNIFGEGSSDILFEGAKTLEMFSDFFTGIMPYFEKASKDRVNKYIDK